MTGIRADANDQIASGHVMRCMTIGRALERLGEKVVFFTADEYGREMISQGGFPCRCLNTDWSNKDGELACFLKAVDQEGCDRLLVDSYEVSDHYLEEVKKRYPVAYIDDMFERVFPADLLINYNGYYSLFPYRDSYPVKTRLLLGPAYVPLREEFRRETNRQGEREDISECEREDISEDIREDKKCGDGSADWSGKKQAEVLLSCGGGDPFHVLAAVLRSARENQELSGVVFHTVVGRFNRDEAELSKLAREYPGIELHFDVKNMAELMGRCDFAVSAAGTMLYELCAMGLPTVFFACADNQQYDRDYFDQEGIMIYAGDLRTQKQKCVEEICNGLIRLLREPELCRSLRDKVCGVTDGSGADRIAAALMEL